METNKYEHLISKFSELNVISEGIVKGPGVGEFVKIVSKIQQYITLLT